MKIENDIKPDQSLMLQSRGALLGFDLDHNVVAFASENAFSIIGYSSLEEMLADDVFSALGREVAHAVRNLIAQPTASLRRHRLGIFELATGFYEVGAFLSQPYLVVEIMQANAEPQPFAFDVLKDVQLLNDVAVSVRDPQEMLDRLVGLLRTVSGFHCVAACRATEEGTEVVAQAGKALAFDFKWDFSMGLHVLADAKAPMMRLESLQSRDLPDLTHSLLRIPSVIGLEELASSGVSACTTLGISGPGCTWGYLILLHQRPRELSLRTHLLMEHLSPLMGLRLTS
ncbi:MAG: hypothetical protein QNJ20_17665 [Paracoccaceae bacterium]|nr:hypothetical protein [Paracoccaceae bacterium]